jgi:hypothetical protein
MLAEDRPVACRAMASTPQTARLLRDTLSLRIVRRSGRRANERPVGHSRILWRSFLILLRIAGRSTA